MGTKKKLNVYVIETYENPKNPLIRWKCVGPNSSKKIFEEAINKKSLVKIVSEKLKEIGNSSLRIRNRYGEFTEERTYNRIDDPKKSKG